MIRELRHSLSINQSINEFSRLYIQQVVMVYFSSLDLKNSSNGCFLVATSKVCIFLEGKKLTDHSLIALVKTGRFSYRR